MGYRLGVPRARLLDGTRQANQRLGLPGVTGRRLAKIRPGPTAELQRRCVYSAHIGLCRGIAHNTSLTPDLIVVLATDDDFAVRLLLCENHADVAGEIV